MKKLKLKALELGAVDVLTRAQLKNVLGGSGSGGTFCAADGVECYTEGSTVYTCSTIWEGDEEKECCCGHSSGNSNCQAA